MKLGIPNRGGGMNIRDVCLSNVLCDDVPSLSSYRSLSILMFGLAPHPFPPLPFPSLSLFPRAACPLPRSFYFTCYVSHSLSRCLSLFALTGLYYHPRYIPFVVSLRLRAMLVRLQGCRRRRFRFRKDESGDYILVSYPATFFLFSFFPLYTLALRSSITSLGDLEITS
jgi:hypothetical protein